MATKQATLIGRSPSAVERPGQALARLAGLDDLVDVAAAGGDRRGGVLARVDVGQAVALGARGRRRRAIALRCTRPTACLGPTTPISAPGQASTRSAPRSFEFIVMKPPP